MTSSAETPSIELDYKTKDGQIRQVRATVVEYDPPKRKLKKEGVASDDDKGVTHDIQDQQIYPPYNLQVLARLPEYSTELHQNIEAMVTNTTGFGWQIKLQPIPEETIEKYKDEIEDEYNRIMEFFESIHPSMDFTEIRNRQLADKHTLGNGYLELIHDRNGNLTAVSHVRGQFIYLLRKDLTPTPVRVPYIRKRDFQIDYRIHYYCFRRYVLDALDGKPIYFKEVGDPRQMDKWTGKYAGEGETIPFEDQATELIHSYIYNAASAYGVPHWIGASVAIAGSREAEEINFNSISNNMVPSMFVLVENGALTDQSIKRLTQFVEKRAASNKNRSSFIILEGEPMNEGGLDTSKMSIKLEPLQAVQQNDELYQQYDKNNAEKIRNSLRIASIYLGKGEGLNKATATVIKATGDEQVFAPERATEDAKINRHIMLRLGARFHYFESNHPNITDDFELIRMMEMAERSGGMTPRRADRIVTDVFGKKIGPMPKEIPLDVPYSLTFAFAQRYDNSGKPDPADSAGRTAPPTPEMDNDDDD